MVLIAMINGAWIFAAYMAYKQGYKCGYDDAVNGEAESERIKHDKI